MAYFPFTYPMKIAGHLVAEIDGRAVLDGPRRGGNPDDWYISDIEMSDLEGPWFSIRQSHGLYGIVADWLYTNMWGDMADCIYEAGELEPERKEIYR